MLGSTRRRSKKIPVLRPLQGHSGRNIIDPSLQDNVVIPSNLETIGWEDYSWKYLSLIGDERVINLQRTKVYVFSDSVLCLGKILENPQSNDAWEQRLGWLNTSQNYRNFDRIDGEPMEFEWNIFPGFTTLEFVREVQKFMNKMGEPEQFQERTIFMSSTCVEIKQSNGMYCQLHTCVSITKKFQQCWSFLGRGSKTKW